MTSRPGETLDDYGMFMTYGEAANADEMRAGATCPEGLVEGCRLRRTIAKDEVLTYDDVELPPGGSPTGCGPSSTGTSAARPGWRSGCRSRMA